MASNVELRTSAMKAAVEAFESERDKLLDQVAHLKGHSDRLEWVIRVLLAQVSRIEQEEAELEKRKEQEALAVAQQQEAMQLAKQVGNIGTHPSERKTSLAKRKKASTENQTVD